MKLGLAALSAWCEAAEDGPELAARAAAEALRGDPWEVVAQAGPLARCDVAVAEEAMGIDARLRPVAPDHPRAVIRVEEGGLWPRTGSSRRRGLGAWDTPREMAERLVELAGPARSALDPGCGAGALLLAAHQAGLRGLSGQDVDPVVVEVARVAVPDADIRVGSAFEERECADLVLSNPPFVSPERQDKALRRLLTERHEWLYGRWDLAVPFAEEALLRAGRRAAFVLPSPLLIQPYGTTLRQRWLERDRVHALELRERFPGATVNVSLVVLDRGGGPAPMPNGVPAQTILRLPSCPLDPALVLGDVEIAEQVRGDTVPLGAFCEVDTGLVAHGPLGGKGRLLHAQPGPGRVPFVDASDLRRGRRRYLAWRPTEMHRPKRPELFESPKLLVQRVRGGRPIQADVDRSGLYAGHTLNVVRPLPDCPVPLEALAELICNPLTDGLLRLARGPRLDLYPRDLRAVRVPLRWMEGRVGELGSDLGLTAAQAARLCALAQAPGGV